MAGDRVHELQEEEVDAFPSIGGNNSTSLTIPQNYPSPPSSPTVDRRGTTASDTPSKTRPRRSSTIASRARAATERLLEADPPPGMWAATAINTAKAPTLPDIRDGKYNGEEGWSPHHQWTGEESSRPPPPQRSATSKSLMNGKVELSTVRTLDQAELTQMYPYAEPPKLPWTTSFMIGFRAFLKWFFTPAGFLITLYGLNVVAWGGMLFLLLCNAGPAMCYPTCNDINSPRRVWIEIDSQILNALFCVTGFGLAPWRFRDCYWALQWRLGLWGNGTRENRKREGIRRLAGIHRGWFRLSGSNIPTPLTEEERERGVPEDSLPIPLSKTPDPPLTGVRAPPTATWRMDYVVWMNASNTFFQIVLCYFMWSMNRYERPSWSTGLFVALGCIVAGLGGIMMFVEGKKVKKIEGVPRTKAEDKAQEMAIKHDLEMGQVHSGHNGYGEVDRKDRTLGQDEITPSNSS